MQTALVFDALFILLNRKPGSPLRRFPMAVHVLFGVRPFVPRLHSSQ